MTATANAATASDRPPFDRPDRAAAVLLPMPEPAMAPPFAPMSLPRPPNGARARYREGPNPARGAIPWGEPVIRPNRWPPPGWRRPGRRPAVPPGRARPGGSAWWEPALPPPPGPG